MIHFYVVGELLLSLNKIFFSHKKSKALHVAIKQDRTFRSDDDMMIQNNNVTKRQHIEYDCSLKLQHLRPWIAIEMCFSV